MSTLQTVLLAGLVGPAYLLAVLVIGTAVAPSWIQTLPGRWDRALLTLLAGTLSHALVAALVLAASPAYVGAALWICAGIALGTLLAKRQRLQVGAPHVVLLALFALCYLLMVSYHFSPARGPTLFWSLYGLTGITPGDSPQGAFQAQYLLWGHALKEGGEFSLFDRPFLGGIITADALKAFGFGFSDRFYDYSPALQMAYASLWIAINAICSIALLSIVSRFARGRAAYLCGILVLVSPFFLLNVIGLWPKLYALTWLWAACLLALQRRPVLACLLSGIAFYAHGSFLWSHIAFCGVVTFYLLAEAWRQRAIPWPALAGSLLLCALVPALWFTAEHIFGGASPLRQYYLYNVPVTEGFHHDAAEIAQAFYATTSPASLSLVPWMNMAKGLLPTEVLQLVMGSSLANPAPSWRDLAESLFQLQFLRALFALGLLGGAVVLRGFFSAEAHRWTPRLLLIGLLLLPLIPGLGLYRRDDHFLLPVMLFAAIPVLVHFCIGMQQLGAKTIKLISLAMLVEFVGVLYWRMPPASYEGEFTHHFSSLVLVTGVVTAILILRAPSRFMPLPGAHDPESIR